MPLPKEHGSWAMLFVPLLVGLGIAEGPAGARLSFAFMALAAFLARVPLVSLASENPAPGSKRWVAAFSGAAALGLAPLLFHYGRWGLAAFAVPVTLLLAWTVRLTLARRQMSLANELAGVAGLSLTAPAGYYAVEGRLDSEAWAAWVLAALFLTGPIFHVKAAVAGHRLALNPAAPVDFKAAARTTLAFHAGTLVLLGAAAGVGVYSPLVLVPFALALVKASRLVWAGPKRADFMRLGWTEVVYSTLFVALVLAAGR